MAFENKNPIAPFTVVDANGNVLFNVDTTGVVTVETANGAKIQIDPTGILPLLHFFSVDGSNDAFINVVNTGNGNADLGINSGKYIPSDGITRRNRVYLDDSQDAAVFECIDEATENTHGGKFQVGSTGAWMGYKDPTNGTDVYARLDQNSLAVNVDIVVDGEGWNLLTLENGWVGVGPGLKFRHLAVGKLNQMVGRIQNGNTAFGTFVGVLPVGYRPATTMQYPVCNNSDGSIREVQINNTGEVVVLGSWSTDMTINIYIPLDYA